jgi:hypothetical protein
VKNNLSVFGLFCLCFSSLALQVALTRVYSVIFIHSYVYLIISVSMAGTGPEESTCRAWWLCRR